MTDATPDPDDWKAGYGFTSVDGIDLAVVQDLQPREPARSGGSLPGASGGAGGRTGYRC